MAAQRWAGAPPRIVDWENVTYRTSQGVGQIWYPPFHGKFAVVADGDPPLQLRTNGQPSPGSWMLSAYSAHADNGENTTLLAMVTHDHVSHDIAGIWVAFLSRCQRYRC